VPKIGDNTVINFGQTWENNWEQIALTVQRPGWASSEALLTTRASVVFDGFDYKLPATTASEDASVKFPIGYDDQRVASATWSQETGHGAIARSSQWINPDSHTVAAAWPTPPTVLNTAFAQGRVVMSWDGKLGNAVAAQISWTTDNGFKSWTLIDRGDTNDAMFPELSGVGSFEGPGGALTGARVLGLSRGVTGYSQLLGTGVAAELVWESALRRSVGGGAGSVQLTEIQSTSL
jgi:hypothetical protein